MQGIFWLPATVTRMSCSAACAERSEVSHSCASRSLGIFLVREKAILQLIRECIIT